MHHVVDEHEWPLGKCQHDKVTDDKDKEWLEPEGAAHDALTTIATNHTFLNNFGYYVNFR